ncbi:AAA family ATPase [Sorangium sp. So ce204]|uniref:AAA family ATPase n=1 Tax=Sorangium sp. So ce204 TaxID=3133288 RepID=UPI003F5D9CC6
MAKPWDITGDDLVRWSQQYDAPSVLPDLVRRLLLATSPLSSISMSAHAGTRLSGVDGVVRSSAETAFCPRGASVWELTVEGELSKLNRDFKKRADDPSPFEPKVTTYVAVSARRFPPKLRWAADKRSLDFWRDVRVLDAEDLAAWLSSAPAVARWFADRLGRPVHDVEDLDGFLERWRRRTRPPLPASIAVIGRERQQLAESVRAWARTVRRDGTPLRIHGATWDEAAAFAAAALALDGTPEGEQVRARTMIIRSADALRWALQNDQDPPLLAIAVFDSASATVGPAILPVEGPVARGAIDVVRLGRVAYRRFEEVLASTGLSEDDAARIAAGSGGSLTSLQRLLGYVELPRWAEGVAAVPLSAVLLVGAFEPDNQEDRDVLALLGADPREAELLCERLRLAPDAPMHREERRAYRAVWTWSAPPDAWKLLAAQIPADSLRRFGDAVRLVLSERDPGLDLTPDERFMAPLHGKVPRASGPLREGMARSLARLSQNDEALAALHGPARGSRLAMSAVRELLPPPWAPWASLAELLPLLAEAAPETFLVCVEASLREGDDGIARLLAEETRFGPSPHTGLLWALETLGWDERLMPRVASVLARLAQYDTKLERPGRMANRPEASLWQLLRIAMPQTRAAAQQRIGEMDRRLRETPDVAFPLLVREIDGQGSVVLLEQSRIPEIWSVKPLSREEQETRHENEVSQVEEAYVNLAFEHAGHDAERWAYFLNNVSMGNDMAVATLERLEAVKSQIGDEQAKVWGAIRHVLHWSRAEEEGADEQDPLALDRNAVYDRWQALYTKFQPQDPALRYAWLFQTDVEIPGVFRRKVDLDLEGREIARLRAEALQDVGRQHQRLEILCALARQANDSRVLGMELGRATFADALDAHLLEGHPPRDLAPLVPSYMAVRWSLRGSEWAEEKLRAMLQQGRGPDVEEVLLRRLPDRTVWDVADALGEDVRRGYWLKLELMLGEHPAEAWERATRSFLDVGNVAGAVKCAEWAKDKLDHETIALVLRAFGSAPPVEVRRFFQAPASSYTLEQLMDRLASAPEADARYGELLASIELLYALGTHEPKRPLHRLSAAFAQTPGLFVDLVKQMYRKSGGLRPVLSETEQDDVRRRAEGAHRVLGSWTGYPGQGLPVDEAGRVLYEWSSKVLRELVVERRPDTGASEVARVLARAPQGEDGFWPCIAARKLLETDEFPALAGGLHIAKRNLRRRTVRSIGEGGQQERALAASYRDAARALRPAWPRTADMLDGLAAAYEGDAARQDETARATLREEGAEPSDFGSPPSRQQASPKRRVVSPGIVHLRGIELTNVTCFEHLNLELQPPRDRGQWLLLLGENGRGKSTLLRALALALAGTNVAQAALGQYPAPILRIGQPSARCEVTCGEQRYTVTISNDGTFEVATCDPTNGARPPVFAYGCRRGSALGGSDAVDLTSPFSDVATLFQPSAHLYPAPSWLKDLKLRALQDPRYDHVFQTLTDKLRDPLLPDLERLDVVGNQVSVIAPKLGGRVPLAALSDGYLTTLGWLMDLVARWLHWAEQVEGKPPEGDFFARMEGLVLIDEIDLHLHPRWQRSVVKLLKDVFPRLSFVATTHNPLTLLGAEAGEIVVLRDAADGSGRPEAKRFDLPPGIRADRILTGEWFGLPYTVDDETIALIERHQQMLLEGVPEDTPERRELEEKLAARYGSYADTSLDRMALEVAADLMRERQPKTPEERADLQRRLKERVRQRLAQHDRANVTKS